MAANINTNIASLNSQRNLSSSQGALATSMQRLSSGLRINSAKDDAAGLAISERFTSQIRGNNQAARNANDGISLAQTAEGGLSTAGDLLQRVRELAVQSANGSNSDGDRKSINNEVAALTQELDRVATTTQFNGQNVLDGSLTSTQFQVGANANQTINIGVASARSSDIGNNTLPTTGTTNAVSMSQASATDDNQVAEQVLQISSGSGITTNVAVGAGDSAKKIAANINANSTTSGVQAQASTKATISGIVADSSVQFTLRGSNSVANSSTSQPVTITASVGADGDLSGLAQAINAQSNATGVTASIKQTPAGLKEIELKEASGNNIQIKSTSSDTGLVGAMLRGADVTAASGATAAVAGAGAAITATANATVGGSLSFSSDTGFSIAGVTGSAIPANGSTGTNDTVLGTGMSVGSKLSSVSSIDVSTVEGANKALLTIDSALTSVNSNRAALGAIQNRFASTISNLQTTTENLSASRSRIQDTDFAAETANMTRGQILQQAGTAILAQANSLPNGVLALLRG